MSKVARLIGNSTWNGLAFLIGVSLNLFSLPYVIAHIGISEFGVAGLILACVAPAMVFSNTLYQVLTRELAQSLSDHEVKTSQNIFSTACALALLVGGSLFALIIAAGPPLAASVFDMGSDDARDLLAAFAIGSAGWVFQCMSATFQAPFAARQDFKSLAKINIATTATSTLSIFVLIPMKPMASTYLACQSLGFGCGFLLALVLALKSFRWHLRAPWMYKAPLKRMFRFGSWHASAQVGALIAAQADRYLIGAFLGARYVGFYNVAQRLEEVIYVGVLKLSEVLFPFFSSIGEEDGAAQRSEIMFRASWLVTLTATTALGAVIPVAEPVLHLWTNANLAAEAHRILIILTLAGMLGCGTIVFRFYLLGRGEFRHNALISLATAGFAGVASVALVPQFGWAAAGFSSLIGMLAQLIMIMMLIRKSFAIPDLSFRVFHFIVTPILIGITAALLLYEGMARQAASDEWWRMGLHYVIGATAIAGAIVFAAALGPYRRICLGDLYRIATHLLLRFRR